MVLLLRNARYEISELLRQGDMLKLVLNGPRLDFSPGQFVVLRYKGVERPYSIASSPTKPFLRFYIRLVNGAFTSRIAHAELGEEVELSGPFGHMSVREGTVCFGGGVGTAPFISMVEWALEQGLRVKVFSSVRKQAEALWLDDLGPLAGDVQFVQHVTREEPVKMREDVLFSPGRITREEVVEAIGAYAHIRICGSKPFAEGIEQVLKEQKVKPERVQVEKW